jgi:lipoprotein-releasing system ATP-binding protein
MKKILTAKKLFKSYGDLQVLKNINIEIEDNEIVAIVGPSGAGKTTLLHILGTLDPPDNKKESSLVIDQNNITHLSDKDLAEFRNKNMGFIFQFHELLPEFTALENVCLPTWIGKNSTNNTKNSAMELLKRLGVDNRASHKPSALSGGEQQRVAVARALVNNPKIIFADEPSGNLDSKNANQLHDLFFELRKERGFSFVIVTHNKDLAKRADRTISLKDGYVV